MIYYKCTVKIRDLYRSVQGVKSIKVFRLCYSGTKVQFLSRLARGLSPSQAHVLAFRLLLLHFTSEGFLIKQISVCESVLLQTVIGQKVALARSFGPDSFVGRESASCHLTGGQRLRKCEFFLEAARAGLDLRALTDWTPPPLSAKLRHLLVVLQHRADFYRRTSSGSDAKSSISLSLLILILLFKYIIQHHTVWWMLCVVLVLHWVTML